MKIFRFAIIALCLAVGTAYATSAFAAGAQARSAVNVRTGPGTKYHVITTLRRNEYVEVTQCTPSRTWCQIVKNGVRGWVSANYLIGHAVDSDPSPVDNNSGFDFGITIGDGFGITIDGGGVVTPSYPNQPSTPAYPTINSAEVCFYEYENFRGRSFCARPGQSQDNINDFWEDRISSIEVTGNATVFVCINSYYRGACGTIRRSYGAMGPSLDNQISSFQIE